MTSTRAFASPVPYLRDRPNLIETGTHLGETARAVAAAGFPVTTIDVQDDRPVLPGVTILHGDSVDVLRTVLADAPPSVLFLDAHSLRFPHVGPLRAAPLL